MKKILGLDMGTNSIGWAVVNAENTDDGSEILNKIEAAGSRIIPMDAAILGDYEKGNSISQTAERTKARGMRRLLERRMLRRERLLRVLNILGFLPKHFSEHVDRYGKLDGEPKLAWHKDDNGTWQFLFADSYAEMLEDFSKHQPQLMTEGTKIPYDWTIYYLRQKALHQPIRKEELAWILLNFNQKRGYNQLRGAVDEEMSEEQEKGKRREYHKLKVVSVEDSGEKRDDQTWYYCHLENGLIYKRSLRERPDWAGKEKELIVTYDIDEKGELKKDKDGNVKYSISEPKPDDWNLRKIRTEQLIDQQNKTVGEYIYGLLLANPTQKVIGSAVQTVERRFYRDELRAIIEKQKQYIAELNNEQLYQRCIDELYASNDAYRHSIEKRSFSYLLIDNILFYQRPLKTKKHLIADCQYEQRAYIEDGKVVTAPVKCIAKSHPLYQEFRLWQFVSNIRIYEREKDVDVTAQYIKDEDSVAAIFDKLKLLESVNQSQFFATCFDIKAKKKADKLPLRWNYSDDDLKTYPCCETHARIVAALGKVGVSTNFLQGDNEVALWHILYSVATPTELHKALARYARKLSLDVESFVEALSKLKPFEKEYGSYSAKAIKKLLPLMRMGKYWNENAISDEVRQRLEKIINGECDETISTRTREKLDGLSQLSDFRGLPLWKACYAVYDRHSEIRDAQKWEKPEDIDTYLRSFKQHSLNNPIVEQVVTETMRVVRDIWKQVGTIDEVHIEMGRDLKKTKKEREAISQRNNMNEVRNMRIKYMLAEFVNPQYQIENVRPNSPSQQDLLRIYEEDALNSLSKDDKEFKFVYEMQSKHQPTPSEVMRYKLWLDQKYVSPYTGKAISLSKLFTSAYEIEHVIPQSRYFDDSLSNKVICEAEVNKLKDNMLGYEFIKAHHGEKVQLSIGEVATILDDEQYKKLVKQNFLGSKAKKLLMDEIPEGFVARQLNDSRYISSLVKTLLSNLVREDGEVDGISKNVITCNGSVTDRLKKDWGMSDVWNQIIVPRFERMNQIEGCSDYTATSANHSGALIPVMPLDKQKGFNKKRIDHRHHAMDAIVIACTSRNHVNLISNEAALSENKTMRAQLQRKLRRYEKVILSRDGETKEVAVPKEFLKPWPSFTSDAKQVLKQIVVSFKQNLRVINKTKNHYQCIVDGKKKFVPQTKGDNWAIRKSLHKDTVSGLVNLRGIKKVALSVAIEKPERIVDKDLKSKVKELLSVGYDAKRMKKYFEANKETWQDVNINKIDVYYFSNETNDKAYASRKALGDAFTQKMIDKVTDGSIRNILTKHLETYNGDSKQAFSPDGIEEMNRNITELNGGKKHQPIYKVRLYEYANKKYAVGKSGNKPSKYVESDNNLFFAVYENQETKKRSFLVVPFQEAVNRMKRGLPVAPTNCQGQDPIFILSPGDLIYLPTADEMSRGVKMPLNRERIFKVGKFTGTNCYFLPNSVAKILVDKVEYQSQNLISRADTGEMIKETCLPLTVDRLGNITHINGTKV